VKMEEEMEENEVEEFVVENMERVSGGNGGQRELWAAVDVHRKWKRKKK